jgi:hypothetical protein
MTALSPSPAPVRARTRSPLVDLLHEMHDAGVKITPASVMHHALERGVDEATASAWFDRIALEQATDDLAAFKRDTVRAGL